MAQTMACSSLIVLALVCGNALASAEEWFKGRATYYGASPEIASAVSWISQRPDAFGNPPDPHQNLLFCSFVVEGTH
eukprot:1154964-Pelagomonas_calceolata.AAC.3